MYQGVGYLASSLGLGTRVYTPSSSPASDNLLLWTEEFDEAGTWTASGVTVVADSATAPDSSSTADRLAFDVSGSIVQLSTTAATTGASVVLSCPLTDTWARFEKKGTYDSADYTFSIYLRALDGDKATTVYLIMGRSGGVIQAGLADLDEIAGFSVYAWGAQLNTGATATTYHHREGT